MARSICCELIIMLKCNIPIRLILILHPLQKSIVEVQWNGTSSKNIYRAGHSGKVSMLIH